MSEVEKDIPTQASGRLRFKNSYGLSFPEWEVRTVDEVLKSSPTRLFQIKSSEIKPTGMYPVVDQSKKIISGYCSDAYKLKENSGVIIFGDHTAIVKYIDFDFIIGADGTKMLELKNNRKDINLKYLFHNLTYNNIEQEGYKRHFSILRNVKLNIPCELEEQQKIAEFLTSVDKRIELLRERKEKLEEYKKGAMQQIFNQEVRFVPDVNCDLVSDKSE